MTACDFGVVREGDGSGYVKVFWPDGGNHVLFFEDGAPWYRRSVAPNL